MAKTNLTVLLGHLMPKGGKGGTEDEEDDGEGKPGFKDAMEEFIQAVHGGDVKEACKAFCALHELVSPDGAHKDPDDMDEDEDEEAPSDEEEAPEEEEAAE